MSNRERAAKQAYQLTTLQLALIRLVIRWCTGTNATFSELFFPIDPSGCCCFLQLFRGSFELEGRTTSLKAPKGPKHNSRPTIASAGQPGGLAADHHLSSELAPSNLGLAMLTHRGLTFRTPPYTVVRPTGKKK